MVAQPTRWNAAAAFLLAVFSIHCNYQNCYLLFGIGTAAAAVAAGRRKFLRSLLVLGMCFVAALTMLVYLPIIASYRGESIVSNFQLGLAQVGGTLVQALSDGNLFVTVAWIALACRRCMPRPFSGCKSPATGRIGRTFADPLLR